MHSEITTPLTGRAYPFSNLEKCITNEDHACLVSL